MKLSPRIIQAMEILQLPVMALEQRITAELQSNPVLELLEPEADDDAPAPEADEQEDRGEHDMVVDEANGNSEDFKRLADFEDEYGPDFAYSDTPARRRPPGAGERDRKLDAMANTPAPEASLNEYLLGQWAFVETDDAVRSAGELIIDNIDDDGYLRMPLEELSGMTDPPVAVELLQKSLKLIQRLEPAGVAARDLKECLLLQLAAEAEAGGNSGLLELQGELVSRFLRDIEMNRLPQIAKRTGRTLDEIKAAIENISHLNPRPGLLVGPGGAPVINPDAVVDVGDDGELIITLPDANAPRLYISQNYRRLAKDRQTDKGTRQFIRDNIRSAQWLIGAIGQRRRTLGRVVESLFRAQRDFLDSGPDALRPLPMAEVARKVGVHVATVSRAVAGKYVQTPRGIYPLRMFFSGGTTTAGGRDVAWDAVKAKLKEIIDAEDKTSPMNDDQLAGELNNHGINIARRTVAKYRKILKIPSARKRRQY